MTEDRKELVLRLPEGLFERIKKFKKMSAVSYTNFIYNAIIWYMVSKGMMTLPELRLMEKEMKKKVV